MKQQLLLLLIVSIYLAESKLYKSVISKKTRIENRQWGGMESNTGNDNFGGWLVRVRCSGPATISCVGAYYSPLLVITSANCVHPFRYQSDGADVVTSAIAQYEQFSFAEVLTFYFPKDFKYLKTKNDIAMAKLIVPLRGRLTEFIKLATALPPKDTMLDTIGWGFNSMEVQAPTELARLTQVKFIKLADCKKMFKKGFLTDVSLCALQPANKLKCIYDGGSPLIWENELVGIGSIGSTCLNTSVPSVYTNILEMTDFIVNSNFGHIEADDDD